MLLFKIFGYQLQWINIIDITLVLILVYQFYRRVRGSLGLNIFFGMILIYILYKLVKWLQLTVLSEILGAFVSAGVIAMLVVFQPEIRKFLLSLGDISISEKLHLPFQLNISKRQKTKEEDRLVSEMLSALDNLSNTKTGALLVFNNHFKLHDLTNPGVALHALVSEKLLESIFNKHSPLHDGAVIIVNNRIIFAGSVLPVSDSPDLPPRAGLRHRSAVGITEHSDAVTLVVSEETGNISYAKNGKIRTNLPLVEVKQLLTEIVTDRI
ncbi:MAG: diadenylate cyclase CdaA [Bacteroidetes bacterium]|nr:diadenylate cyclase CdaA [Bacteroidota bacterium]